MATRFVARSWSRIFVGYAGKAENGKPHYGVTTNKRPVFSVSRVSRLLLEAKNVNTASASWLRSGISDILYTINLSHHGNSARESRNVVPVEASNPGRRPRFLYWAACIAVERIFPGTASVGNRVLVRVHYAEQALGGPREGAREPELKSKIVTVTAIASVRNLRLGGKGVDVLK
ncbi:MAG: hypothetical protein GY850_01740 [bacterium]|nr:hypothetical protein [bacterium]